MNKAILQTSLDLPVRRGKVRDVYDLGDKLLIVATDRISAFDVIMPNGIPDKGRILNSISLFWFGLFPQFENHLISSKVSDYPSYLHQYADQLEGRSMLVKKTRVVPIECVVRGYITGSGWKEYLKTQSICGIKLPPGLKQCDQLPEPIFTPSTKEETGHDINISFEQMLQRVEPQVAQVLKNNTIGLYKSAADYARKRGVIIADTKFEFGVLPDGKIILIDEVLTPDSSRFWPADQYQPGKDQPSYDKQFVRNYLETLSWNKTPPGPTLPDDVVMKTREKYLEAYERLTGKPLKV